MLNIFTASLETKYWKRARFAAYFLQSAPFLRMIGVNGSLAHGKATQKSDIDFLIVATSGRIWTCRFILTLIVTILGIKRINNKTRGRICLNRFITNDSLTIYPYDEYHAVNYSKTIPIFDRNTYQQFIKQNAWMSNFVEIKELPCQLVRKSSALLLWQRICEKILSRYLGLLIEKNLKKLQLNKMKNNPLTLQNKGLIIANDQMLCFHPTSKFHLTNLG